MAKIKDVSKRWAAILESEEAADEAYGVACDRSCEEAEELEREAIEECDERPLSLAECGFENDIDEDEEVQELTEADEAEAKQKMVDSMADAKKETKSIEDADDVKKYFAENKAKIQKNIDKIKDKATRDRIQSVMDIIEKVANGQITIKDVANEAEDAEELNEKAGKSDKSKVASVSLQFVKAAIRLLLLVCYVVPYGCLGVAWVVKKLGQASQWVLDKCDAPLATESEKPVSEDDIELEADGVTVKEAADEVEEDEDELDEADYRDPASHLLDVAGVKASTASLKAQDAAMISVVESLLKKIDKLEERLDEATKKSSKKAIKEAEAEEDDVKEADESFEDDDKLPEFDELGLTAPERKDYEAAKQIQELSYERALTKAEEDKFRALLKKLPDLAKDHLLSNTMGKTMFARPGNHVVLPHGNRVAVDDGQGHYTGDTEEIPPVNYQIDPDDKFQAKSLAKRAEKAAQLADKLKAAVKVPARGQDTWSEGEWKELFNSIAKAAEADYMKKNNMKKSTREVTMYGKKAQQEWLDDLCNDIRKDYGDDTVKAELDVAFVKTMVGKKLTDDDFKDFLNGLVKKPLTKQGAGKRGNLYANAIRQAFITVAGSKLTAEQREKILSGIKVPGAAGLSAIGIPDKLVTKMSEGDLMKFCKEIRRQIDAIQTRKGADWKDAPSDEELKAIEAGDETAGEVKTEAEDAEEVDEADDGATAEQFFKKA